MKKLFFIVIFGLLTLPVKLLSQSDDKIKVKEVIVDSYIHGLIDARDFGKAKEGIHEDFVILNHRDTLLIKKTRDQWIEQRKKRGKLEYVTYDIVFVDIEGEAASAKIELKRGELHVVDYVFLYKFKNGWRIVSAIDTVKR